MKSIIQITLILIKSLFLIFVLLSMANLTFELMLKLRPHLSGSPHKQYINNPDFSGATGQRFLIDHSLDIFNKSQIHYLPSIGQAFDFTHATSFEGTFEGRRVTPSKSLENKQHQGIMLGASQSWGYFAPNQHIVSQILMDILGDVGVDNYSMLGLTVQQSTVYWQSVKNTLPRMDFVLEIGGVIDVYVHCYSEPSNFLERQFQTGLEQVYNKIKTKLFNENESNINFCSTERQIQNVVRRIINDLEYMSFLAKKNNINFAIIIPPAPFMDGPNTKNLDRNPNFKKLKSILGPVYNALDKEVYTLKDSNIVNLMHIFDDNELYFLDYMGHLNKSGHRKLAESIIESIGEDFFRSAP